MAPVVTRFSRIDSRVNMASVYTRTPFDSLRHSDFDARIAAYLVTAYHASVATGQQMSRQYPTVAGRPLRGKIVTIGDGPSPRRPAMTSLTLWRKRDSRR